MKNSTTSGQKSMTNDGYHCCLSSMRTWGGVAVERDDLEFAMPPGRWDCAVSASRSGRQLIITRHDDDKHIFTLLSGVLSSVLSHHPSRFICCAFIRIRRVPLFGAPCRLVPSVIPLVSTMYTIPLDYSPREDEEYEITDLGDLETDFQGGICSNWVCTSYNL